jgi:hypothetical protein
MFTNYHKKVISFFIFARYFTNMRFILLFVFIGMSSMIQSQINEIGVFAGGSNIMSDVGDDTYLNPSQLAYGLIYKWNRSTRHSYRLSVKRSMLEADDKQSSISGRNLRNFKFENNITEISVGFEFNFFDFDLHDFEYNTTPYIFTGINYIFYDEIYHTASGYRIDKQTSALSIPFVLGIKSRLASRFIIGAEIGARYSLTDNLDGSNPVDDRLARYRFGNLNSNDWYMFMGLTLTYTFGRNPCFCPY